MYDYFIGKIVEVKATGIVLENSNVGYFISTPNPYAFIENSEYKVYVYTQIKEDEHNLYGFKSLDERELFLKLINVKGLGPKMALPILATGSINGIVDAIERENILYLKKFPKIGEKLAKQIILDLKGKLGIVVADNTINDSRDELIDVLKGLGYKEKEFKAIIPKVNSDNSIEEQVKEALKLLLK